MRADDAEGNSTYIGKNKTNKKKSSGDKTASRDRETRSTRNWFHLLELLAKRALYIPQNTRGCCQCY